MAAAGEGRLFRIYLDVPVVTRIYTTACLLLTFATNCEIISQYQIYLNPRLIVEQFQFWRIVTCFLYMGPFDLGTVFTFLFLYRESRSLEENFFPFRSADYCFMLLLSATIILILSWMFTTAVFLGHALTHTILYLWCRRNPNQRVIIFGFWIMPADVVPVMLFGLSILTGGGVSTDIIAITAGHVYYFLEDVFPRQPRGFRILRTPQFLKVLFNEYTPESPNRGEPVVDENNLGGRDGINPPPPLLPAEPAPAPL